MMFGVQQIMERSYLFLQDNDLFWDRISSNSSYNILDYYYLYSFLIKPIMYSLDEIVDKGINDSIDRWQLFYIWMLSGLALYLVIYVMILTAYIWNLKKNHEYYSIFYLIIPKKIRANNEALRKHIADLIEANK